MANLICAKCNEKIDEENLIECPHCWEMYHRECWEDTKYCLNCKKFNLDFARIQAENEDEQETELNQYEGVSEESETEEADENVLDFADKEINHSPIANNIMFLSKAVLIIGVIIGILITGYMFFTGRLTGGIIGLVMGAIVVAISWILSVLVNGFAELINNTQKNSYYLSKLVEKKENEEKGTDD